MNETGDSTELADELFLEQKTEDTSEPAKDGWHKLVALSTLFLAQLAALGGLLSGITANESLIQRTQEIINISIQQAEDVEMDVLKTKHEILIALSETPDTKENERILLYEEEVAELDEEAKLDDALVVSKTHSHMIFAIAVTILAISIALSGMSVVLEQKWLWGVGLFFGAAGAFGVVYGIFSMVK